MARIVAIVALGGGVLLSSCSPSGSDFADAAAELIEGELATELGVTFTEVSCEEPASTEVGDEFSCTAALANDAEVTFSAEIAGDDRVTVASDNVVVSDPAPMEQVAAEELTRVAGVELPAENFDCGEGPLVAGPDGEIECTLIDPANGDEYDATVTLTDDGDFDSVSVAEAPRA